MLDSSSTIDFSEYESQLRGRPVIGDIVQIISLMAVAVTIYFASLQTKGLREQVKISNLVGRYETLNHASERYDVGLQLIFHWPSLRPYIFGGKPVDLHGDDLGRALIVADLMAGATDYGLRVGERFPDDPQSVWVSIAVAMAGQPLFRALLDERPCEFPDLVRYFSRSSDPNQGPLAE